MRKLAVLTSVVVIVAVLNVGVVRYWGGASGLLLGILTEIWFCSAP